MIVARTRTPHCHVVLLGVSLLIAPEAPVVALHGALWAVAVGLFAGRVEYECDKLVARGPLAPGYAPSEIVMKNDCPAGLTCSHVLRSFPFISYTAA